MCVLDLFPECWQWTVSEFFFKSEDCFNVTMKSVRKKKTKRIGQCKGSGVGLFSIYCELWNKTKSISLKGQLSNCIKQRYSFTWKSKLVKMSFVLIPNLPMIFKIKRDQCYQNKTKCHKGHHACYVLNTSNILLSRHPRNHLFCQGRKWVS